MPFKPGALAHLKTLETNLNLLITNRVDRWTYDFNKSPTHGILAPLKHLIANHTDPDEKLVPHLIWIAYHVGMIVTHDSQGKYMYGTCPQPPASGYSGDVVQYWLNQISTTLSSIAQNLHGLPPSSTGDALAAIDYSVGTIPNSSPPSPPFAYPRSAPGKS